MGGGETCTTRYSYTKGWSATHISSDGFHDAAFHPNPRAWAAEPAAFAPPALHAGAFLLPPALQARLGANAASMAPLPFANTSVACAGTPAACAWAPDGDAGLYYHATSFTSSPAVGDLRVSWAFSRATAVSVIGVQVRVGDDASSEATFAPYIAKSGHSCFLLAAGLQPPEALIQAAQARNKAATWVLRILGILLNFFGIALFMKPLGVALDLVPLVGPFVSDLVQMGVGVAAGALSLALCSLTIAAAWLAVRPAIGVPLLLLSFAAAAGLVAARERRRRGAGGAAGSASPQAQGYSAELNTYGDA